MTSRDEPATLISWSLPRQRDVTPYRSPGCADVLRGARADVTDFSYKTLMDTSVVKHNMLIINWKQSGRGVIMTKFLKKCGRNSQVPSTRNCRTQN